MGFWDSLSHSFMTLISQLTPSNNSQSLSNYSSTPSCHNTPFRKFLHILLSLLTQFIGITKFWALRNTLRSSHNSIRTKHTVSQLKSLSKHWTFSKFRKTFTNIKWSKICSVSSLGNYEISVISISFSSTQSNFSKFLINTFNSF